MNECRRVLVLAGLILALQCPAVALARGSGVIRTPTAGEWRVDWWCGGPATAGFVQGPRADCGLSGKLAFDRDGAAYAACGTFIARVPKAGPVRIIAGTPGVKGATDGPPERATFADAMDIDICDGALYVVDRANYLVRKLERRNGRWHTTTLAGVPGRKGHRDGPARSALFSAPFDSIAVDEKGVVYVLSGDWLRRIADARVTTLNAGTGRKDGPLKQAGFRRAMAGDNALAYDGKGNLYVADRWNMAIRKVDLRKKVVTTHAGSPAGAKRSRPRDGPALEARFHGGGGPCSVLYNREHDAVLVTTADEGRRIRWIREGMVTTFALHNGRPTGPLTNAAGGGLAGVDPDGNIYVSGFGGIRVISKKGAK